jgi:foldase protein PrsA
MTAVLRNRHLALLAACCAAVVLVAAACGGSSSSSVPSADIALVDGQPITQARFAVVYADYCLSQKAAKQPCPKKGSAADKSAIQNIVNYLVTRSEIEQEAKKAGIPPVTPQEVDAEVAKQTKQSFGGSHAKLLAELKKQGATLTEYRDVVGFNLLEQRLVDKLTKNLKVSDAEAKAYYLKNIAQYTTPESRDLEHILVKTKAKAQSIYNQIKNGASFAKLAKKYSTDTSSAVNGGKLGVQAKSSLVAPFANVAFSIKTGVLSEPVHSQFGWHLIEALGPVIPKSVAPFSKEKASIVANLLQTKKSDTLNGFQNKVSTYYKTRIKYQNGYAPPATTNIVPQTTNSVIPGG